VTTTHIRTVKPSIATNPGISHTLPDRNLAIRTAILATNSDHTSRVSATGTNGESTVVSGSAPTVGFELCPDIVHPIVRPVAVSEAIRIDPLLVVCGMYFD
jgi:hypothetical protein